jgi:hypothetical protein
MLPNARRHGLIKSAPDPLLSRILHPSSAAQPSGLCSYQVTGREARAGRHVYNGARSQRFVGPAHRTDSPPVVCHTACSLRAGFKGGACGFQIVQGKNDHTKIAL